jgi:hypothetical protein
MRRIKLNDYRRGNYCAGARGEFAIAQTLAVTNENYVLAHENS